MPSTVKKSPFIARLENRGQAVIEYTLILVVVVAILLALLNVVFKPFGDFVSNYMGKYTACLLEYGELPSLGSQNPAAADEDSECNKKFQPGSLTAGRPPRNDNNGNNSSSNSSSQKNATNSSSSSSKSSGSYAGSSSRDGSRYMVNRRRPSSGVESSANRSGKVVEIALENGGAGGFFRSSNVGSYGGPPRKYMSVGLTGLTESEKKKLERKADGVAGTVVSTDSIKIPKKKMTVKPPEKETVTPPDEPFTIGNFIRYLFIAAIILAIIVFVGGQALQMSKSYEK